MANDVGIAERVEKSEFASTNANVRVSEHPRTFTIDTETIPWTPMGAGGYFKLLHVDHGTNRMTTLFRLDPGAVFQVHKHYAPVEFFVLQGAFGYEAGIARKWGYGYEGAPSIHEPICAGDEPLIMLSFTHGGFQLFNEDGSPGEIIDATHYIKWARENNALAAVERIDSVPPPSIAG
jgi:quercetin dioxygenase-like cupin family protein